VSGHAKMPPASHQVSATPLKLLIRWFFAICSASIFSVWASAEDMDAWSFDASAFLVFVYSAERAGPPDATPLRSWRH
jgi:hypothetical protein